MLVTTWAYCLIPSPSDTLELETGENCYKLPQWLHTVLIYFELRGVSKVSSSSLSTFRHSVDKVDFSIFLRCFRVFYIFLCVLYFSLSASISLVWLVPVFFYLFTVSCVFLNK